MTHIPEKQSVTVPPARTPSCAVFNSQLPNDPSPLGYVLNDETSLSFDSELLELCLNEMGVLTPDHDPSSPQNNNQECTNNSISMPMDDPLLDQFTDLSALIDSSLFSSLTFPLEPEPLKLPSNDTILDMDTPSSIMSMSSPLSPSTSADMFIPSPLSTSPSTPSISSCTPSPLERKRKSPSTEETPASSKKPVEKYVERRKKNNVASQVSRAKRRKRNGNLFSREKELEAHNAELRVKVEEMTKEAERLKKLLINQLAH